MAIGFQRESAAPFNRNTRNLRLLKLRRKARVARSYKLRSMIERRPPHPSSCHTAAYLLALVEDQGPESSLLQSGSRGQSRHTRTNYEHVGISMEGILHLE